ncbi:lipoyl(octanoyl) transferase LipB [Thermonema rossianum]|uniref:lipoyl(octanoyl) transferase LipB n=1 Tax=Thermonema rossianum TaxID=55505 RepID=UPI0005710434|nr:lipoyl(octanoyl) transferase LipB [Thermonema rossianum]
MKTKQNREVEFRHLGNIDYQEAWDYQSRLFDGIVEQKRANYALPAEEQRLCPNYLLFCSHPHVFTLGKTGSLQHLLLNEQQMREKGISFYKINRGGDITYHGPGQIVGYPILDLDNFFTDIGRYIRSIEEVIIRTLAEYGLDAGRIEGLTGVWLGYKPGEVPRKICAIGVRTSRWVTMHGFAFNINTDLQYFNYIVPCGISDKAVTSLAKELGHEVNIQEVEEKLKRHFEAVFECRLFEKHTATR